MDIISYWPYGPYGPYMYLKDGHAWSGGKSVRGTVDIQPVRSAGGWFNFYSQIIMLPILRMSNLGQQREEE